MGGHVLWTSADLVQPLDAFVRAASKGDLTDAETVEILKPLLDQFALREQVAVIRRMCDVLGAKETVEVLGYSEEFVSVLADPAALDPDSEYRYSAMPGLHLFAGPYNGI